MKKVTIGIIFASGLVASSCVKMLGEDCHDSAECTSGDGDGDLGGVLSDGGNPSGGKGGDGDGDSGGTGGTELDPCDECQGDTPACNENDECVECTADDAAACTGETSLCDIASQICVQCLEKEDCSDPTAPVCDDGSCTMCTGNDDCSHLSDTPICELGAGACVECTPATEETECGAKSCDPATFTCGAHDRQSRGTCRACVSDSDCISNHRCVPMEYPTGTPRTGGYCLELSGSCNNPYTVVLSGRTTLSGVSGESFCGIDEDLTTCEAVRALADDLRCDHTGPGDGQCWPASGTVADAVEVPGALCRKFDGLAGDRCTYACSGASDCKEAGAGSLCGAGVDPDPVTPDFCGGVPD